MHPCGHGPIASLILKEIASEREGRKAFAKSEDKLAQLADEALAQFRERKTKPLEFSTWQKAFKGEL
jgi:hypothetical protein